MRNNMKILFLGLLISLPLFGSPQGVPLPPVVVTVGTTSTLIIAANLNRGYLMVQNQGASTINCYISLAGPITANAGLLVVGGQNYEVVDGFTKSAVYGMCASPTTWVTQEINY